MISHVPGTVLTCSVRGRLYFTSCNICTAKEIEFCNKKVFLVLGQFQYTQAGNTTLMYVLMSSLGETVSASSMWVHGWCHTVE